MIGYLNYHSLSLIQILDMLQKHYMFQNAPCAKSVSLLQNSEMFENGVVNISSSKSSPMETVFIFIGEFMFSIGEFLDFIGENLQFPWISFQMGIKLLMEGNGGQQNHRRVSLNYSMGQQNHRKV